MEDETYDSRFNSKKDYLNIYKFSNASINAGQGEY